MTRRNRPNRERRALAAQGRAARRARLRNLIDRAGRVTLTPQEADALRGAAEAEFTESDALRATVGGQQAAANRHVSQLDAAHTAIREAEQHAADLAEQLRQCRAVEEQRQMHARLLSPEEQRQAAEEHRARVIAAGTFPADRIRAFLAEQTAHLTPSTPEQP
ncbi:hypothetical protein ACPXCP_20305 [Streptomyces sp. DT20]|uniref:hypothetical protein n=1 Tax=Streptomyces sp. DT20 TaxID=3416519 RepID=UPI003CEB6A4C